MTRLARRLATALLLAPRLVAAQSGAELAREASEVERHDPARALGLYRGALALDSAGYELNWRAALAATDVLEAMPEPVSAAARDSLLGLAERFARRAVRADSNGADGLFALSAALGRIALGKSKRDRIRYGDEVYRLASRAVQLAPGQDGAHHVLGLWHAEIMRLSGLSRFLAKRLLGAKLLDRASWEDAVTHLERATAIAPTRLLHRLDLARVYVDRKRFASARAELEAVERLPNAYPGDERYRKEAAALLARIKGRTDPEHGAAGPVGS